MKETKNLLLDDYMEITKLINNTKINDEKFTDLLKERDNIRNELIKIDSVYIDNKKIESDDKHEKNKNIIAISSIIVSAGVGIWTVVKTFRFDKDYTITSTLGRGIVNNTVSKLFKK